MSSSTLFKPLQVGTMALQHRVALAPLTRTRASKEHAHGQIAVEYYEQRASTPGTLLISEATFIAPQAGGMNHVPGIWSDAQIAAWKTIVDAVHAKGSFIYLQLWALGRAASGAQLKSENPDFKVVSASDLPLNPEGDKLNVPTALTEEEIHQYQELYVTAAKNFVEKAGGDGVELHSANGYLIDQFTQTNSNKRTDRYGGSVENRTRFLRETLAALSRAIGEDRVGFRLSPHSEFQGMKMPAADIHETFSYIAQAAKDAHPNLAYLHATEPRVSGGWDTKHIKDEEVENLDFLHKIWAPRPFIVAGAYKPDTAQAVAERWPNTLVAFGRPYISNPDLPLRIKKGIELAPYDRKTFYLQGPEKPEGYTDYPFAETSKL